MDNLQIFLSLLMLILLTLLLLRRPKGDASFKPLAQQLVRENAALSERLSALARDLQGDRQERHALLTRELGQLRDTQEQRFHSLQNNLSGVLQQNRSELHQQLHLLQTQLDSRLAALGQQQSKEETLVQAQLRQALSETREELNQQLHSFQTRLEARLSDLLQSQLAQSEKLTLTLDQNLRTLRESNEKRLGQMQEVVQETLQKTLETRLAQSFQLVGKQLESVQLGLGEMKSLAADAKSLKNALTNVKERGNYGEIRLEKLLSDILAPNQYLANVEIRDGKRVEFAVKLPGTNDLPLLLPIDAKFPMADYNRLLEAQNKSDIDAIRKSLAKTILRYAKDIHDKYIVPPKTTDFALMFLPTEGLYAEVTQNPQLFQSLRETYQITPVGATTLSAFLSSLQIGFKTLAIEQRSLEVWGTLRSVKSEFAKFGALLEKAQRQIQTADKTLGEIVGPRTRAMHRSLRQIEEDAPTHIEP